MGITYTAQAKMYTDTDKTCVVNTSGTNTFYFCGKHSESCAGRKMHRYHHRNWMEHGEFTVYDGDSNIFNMDDDKIFFCCIKDDGTGYFKPQQKWIYNTSKEEYEYNNKTFSDYNTTEVIVRQLPGGTCRYVRTMDMCGKIVKGTPCTKPDTCTNGHFMRNGSCVKPCDAGYVFESEYSNQCIACPTSASQGIDANDTCIKCTPPTQIYDAITKKCVATKAVSKQIMQQCFRCDNNESFKLCINALSLPIEQRESKSDWQTIKTNCYLD